MLRPGKDHIIFLSLSLDVKKKEKKKDNKLYI